MSGWRGKIGIISVIGDGFEEYVHAQKPIGVSVISTKLPRNYTKQQVVEAFRCFVGHNVDVLLFAGEESLEEVSALLQGAQIGLDGKVLLTRKSAIASGLQRQQEAGNLLVITPYEEEDPWSDVTWLDQGGHVLSITIPLAGVTDEGLPLEDATDYWRYHRVVDALKNAPLDQIDAVYIEDLELGVADLLEDFRTSFHTEIDSTQRILWNVALESCGIPARRV